SLPANCTAGEYFAPTVAPSGAITITAVSAADPSKQGQATVTINGAADPTLTSMSPNTVTPSGASTNLSLIGGYFSPNSPTTTTFNGQTLATTFNSSRQLTANIASGAVTGPGL